MMQTPQSDVSLLSGWCEPYPRAPSYRCPWPGCTSPILRFVRDATGEVFASCIRFHARRLER